MLPISCKLTTQSIETYGKMILVGMWLRGQSEKWADMGTFNTEWIRKGGFYLRLQNSIEKWLQAAIPVKKRSIFGIFWHISDRKRSRKFGRASLSSSFETETEVHSLELFLKNQQSSSFSSRSSSHVLWGEFTT